MNYSGKTTSMHPIGFESKGDPAIKQVTVLDVQWSDCPVEVEDDVRKLWRDNGLNNDVCIYKWEEDDFDGSYPILEQYLKGHNIKECWIHWWW